MSEVSLLPFPATHPPRLELAELTISVVAPAFNEEGNVGRVVEKVARCFAEHGWQGELILVNDGSTDGTAEEAENAAQQHEFVRVFHHRRNRGLTEALRTGLDRATGEVVMIFPADLEADPEEDIPKLLGKLDEGYDVVAGWRQGRHDGKVFASKIYNWVCRRLFHLDCHDMNWIKALRREALDDLELRSDWHRFILMILAEKGYKIGEVKVNYHPRQRGKSKFGFWRIPVSFLDVLVVKFILTFSRKPMLFFGGIGMILGAIGLGTGGYLFFQWVAGQLHNRPLVLFAVLFVLAGLLLFLVGFLAELVVNQQERLDEIERRLAERR